MNKASQLGPLPAPEPPEGDSPRAAILTELRGTADPITVADLAKRIQAHPNTVRHALAEMLEDEHISRVQLPSTGRGRPTYGYLLSEIGRSMAPAHPAFWEYRGLTEAFAQYLLDSASDPGEAAREIGRRWGGTLASTPLSAQPARGSKPGDETTTTEPTAHSDQPAPLERPGEASQPAPGFGACERTVQLLADLGFSPTKDEKGLGLRTCPLLDLAQEIPEVICQVHQGLIEGALDHYGRSDIVADLTPFAEVGACRLALHDPRRSDSAAETL